VRGLQGSNPCLFANNYAPARISTSARGKALSSRPLDMLAAALDG
jgi:hypothetical protein